jgi:hypothetical protein
MLPLTRTQMHFVTLVPLESTSASQKGPYMGLKTLQAEIVSPHTPAAPVPAGSSMILTLDDVTFKLPFSDQTAFVLHCYLVGGLPVDVEGGRATSNSMFQVIHFRSSWCLFE